MDGVDEEVDEGEETHGEGGEDHGIVYSKTPPTTPIQQVNLAKFVLRII